MHARRGPRFKVRSLAWRAKGQGSRGWESEGFKGTCGMVPDILDIRRLGLGRQAKVNFGIAPREHCVLALAIDAERRGGDAKLGGDQRRSVVVAVRLLDALTEPQGRQILLLTPHKNKVTT